MPSKPDKSLMVIGKYLSMAFTLPSSVLAGYLVGTFADHFLHIAFLRALGVLIGMGAGLVKIVQELAREERKSRGG